MDGALGSRVPADARHRVGLAADLPPLLAAALSEDVLATLRRNGPPYQLRPTDFAGQLMITSSGTTKRLDRLEQAGLITRAPDPDDRRGTLITLTEAGHGLIDAVTEAHLDNERHLLSALDDDEQRQLADLLRRLQLGLPSR